MRRILACWLPWFLAALQGLAVDIYLAPHGSANGDGSSANPFGTLIQARDASRKLPHGQVHRIFVQEGSYYDASCTLDPRDDGLIIEAVPGAKPVFYGGVLLSQWKPFEGKFVCARLPERFQTAGSASPINLRMLVVDGKTCPRARFPESGTLEHESQFDVPWMSTTGGGWKRPPTQEELTTLKYKTGSIPATFDFKNAEITVFHMWDESCVGVVAHDPTNRILKLNPPSGHPPGAFGVKKYVVWNTREGLTHPGQWYFDRERAQIVYWPLPGQDMGNVRAIIPTQTTILAIRGNKETKVRQIVLRGLGFSVTTVPLITGGFAAEAFDGALALDYASGCTLRELTITQVAGHGINGRTERNEEIKVENCEVGECGAGGIYLGGRRTIIYNCHVFGVGRMFSSAVGIFRGGERCLVSHNEVHDCSYSAINYGGDGNILESNLIYDCMRVLHDGAGIYLFGARNCIIRGNYVRDIVDTGGYGASAYYLDEQSRNCIVENNFTTGVGWPSHNHMATNNIIRNNIFVVEGDAKLTFPRSSGYGFVRNLVYATGTIRFENQGAVTNWSRNLLYSGKDTIELVNMEGYSIKDTIKGSPGDSTVADPGFRDPAHKNYTLSDQSPARRLGIMPLDPMRAGRVRR